MHQSWPHAPVHWLFEPGLYIVTVGTYKKQPLLNTPERRDMVLDQLFACAKEFNWHLQAWAIMPNHYHFVARTDDPKNLPVFMRKFHGITARTLNKMDSASGRRVWFDYWDTHLTNEKSWLARLRYVHENPVHHGIAGNAESYEWCSAAWLVKNANRSFIDSLSRFKTDRVSVPDEY